MRKGRLKVLLVEDDDSIRQAMCEILSDCSVVVLTAATQKAALEQLDQHPDLLVLDIKLPDGSGIEVARKASQLNPAPLCIVVSGQTSAAQAFELQEYGVNSYLAKPFTIESFTKTIDEVLNQVPEIAPLLKTLVGRESFKHVQHEVRRTMVVQALSLSEGNITKAAELLGITRQAVQHMVKELDLDLKSFSQE